MKLSTIGACVFYVAFSAFSVEVKGDVAQKDALESFSGGLSHGDRSLDFSSHPSIILRTIAAAAVCAAPAGVSEPLFDGGLTKGLQHPDYPLYWAFFTENALYAFAAVLARSLAFRNREVVK